MHLGTVKLMAAFALSQSLGLIACPNVQAQDVGSVLRLDIDAELAQRCGIARNGIEPDAANLDLSANIRFGFLLDCNAPFRIGVSAQHGKLQWIGGAPGEDGFAYTRDYSVSLDFETSGGTIRTEPCAAEDLVQPGRCAFFGRNPGEGLSTGSEIATTRPGALLISWPADGGGNPRRAAGSYQDMITIVVGVRI